MPNGVRLYFLNDDTPEVFTLKLILPNGTISERKPLSGTFFCRWAQEADKALCAEFEQMGFGFSAQANADFCEFSIAGLSRFAVQGVELLKRLYDCKNADPKEFEQIKTLALEGFKVSEQKTSFLASTTLKAELYGLDHPLGYHVGPQWLEPLTLDDCLSFQQEFIARRSYDLLFIGTLNEVVLAQIEVCFGQNELADKAESFFSPLSPVQSKKIFIPMPQAKQASIALGKPVCKRNHEDYFALLVLNEVLGGYFGSRLMASLREKHGLTYGIYSQLSFTKNSASLSIGADLNRENLEKALELVQTELEDLQNRPIEEPELLSVKNHIAGSMLRSTSSAFSVGNSLYFALFNSLGEDFFLKTLNQVQIMEAQTVQQCAKKYLSGDWIEVSCG
jgi:predicted Zn-dependent peptidase